MVYTPSMPVWNPYAPNNLVGGDLPMAFFDSVSGGFYPVLASSWTEDLANQTLIVHLRKGLYWYNGSATLPFTAWDVYTEFYIGTKVFSWYSPMLNYSGVRLINNYTVEFAMTKGLVTQAPYILASTITTPYEIWKPLLNKLVPLNNTQAQQAHNNVTEFVVPAWTIGPYYQEKVSPPYIMYHLEPSNLLAEWAAIFPYHTWQYYNPVLEIYDTGGNTQSMNAMIAGQDTQDWCGLSTSQLQVLGQHNVAYHLTLSAGIRGIMINQSKYPWDIPQVRQAVSYAINRSEAVSVWGNLYLPLQSTVPLTVGSPIPSWLRPFAVNFTYDPAKAASMLQSLGFYKKNGDWYTPNGTELTLSVDVTAGWTDVDTIVADVANQLTAFGIPTKEYEVPFGTLWGTIIPDSAYQAAAENYALQGWGYSTIWIMGNPFAGFHTWNKTALYPFEYPNGTKGYFNMSKWYSQFVTEVPGTAAYNSSVMEYTAFTSYWLPTIPIWEMREPMEYNTQTFNLSWAWKLPTAARKVYDAGAGQIWGSTFRGTIEPWYLFGITPPGISSPFVEAMKNDSLTPQTASFMGLSPAYSANYIASLTKLTVSISASATSAGQPVSLSATAKFVNSTPMSDQPVTFYVNGEAVATATTNSQGTATVTYTPKTQGSYAITAGLTNYPSLKSSQAVLTVSSATLAPFSVSVSSSSVTAGIPVNFSISLHWSNGSVASDQPVTFYVNGEAVATATTNSQGTATVTYTPKTQGSYAITAGLTNYPSLKSSQAVLTVSSAPTSNSLYVGLAVVIVVIAAAAAWLFLRKKSATKRTT